MKKYAVRILTISVEVFEKYSLGGSPDPKKIEVLNMPNDVVVNRVTFQTAFDVATNQPVFALINTKPMSSVNDGVRIIPSLLDAANNVWGAAAYTFENFNGEEILTTFYVANISNSSGALPITVIIEGYQR